MQHVGHLLDEYHDDELSPAIRRRVEAHMQGCSSCRAELERLDRLSGLLSEYALPADGVHPQAFTAPEIFQAQVALRVTRRVGERSGYRGLSWHLVPLALLSVVVAVQALFGLSALLGTVARSVQSLGLDVSLVLTQLGIAWPEVAARFGLSLTSLVTYAGLVLMVGSYLGMFVLLVPYAGWVGALWRSARAGQASGHQ